MIDDENRYICLGGDSQQPGGPTTWHITDWDRRRVVSVTMDGEHDDESLFLEHFPRHSDQLSPGTYRIYLSPTGDLISTHSDPDDDPTYFVHYPLLSEISLPEGVQTVRRSELEELDRFGPDVDLVTYPPLVADTVSPKKVVFKYYFHWQFATKSWKEMNMWMHLPRHPNIVPFDRVVVDELENRVVGFTSLFVPGGTLDENKSRVFKLKWLQQLIDVVDLLNLEYRVAHQDIAPRNLVVDEAADAIMLFDFNYAARVEYVSREEREVYSESRNDVKGVLFTVYEIITQDTSLRNKPHQDQNIGDIDLEGREWVQHPDVKLDHPVASYQQMLRAWKKQRTAAGSLFDGGGVQFGSAQKAITWPSRPKPPQQTIPTRDREGNIVGSYTMELIYEMRQDVWARAEKGVNWERPVQSDLEKGTRLLSTGEIIRC